jgi:hypothetical protein
MVRCGIRLCMKILVRFKGDNDFGTLMRAFGEILFKNRQPEELDSKQVAEWFNKVAPTLYFMVQHNLGGSYGQRTPEEHREAMEGYLQIEPEDVYIGDEVEAKMAKWYEWGNHDSVLVDWDEYSKQPISIV